MNKVTADEMKQLQAKEPSPAVTMYLPAHRAATLLHIREDRVRFKNLVRKASDILNNIDKYDPFNVEFAKQCTNLSSQDSFWKDRTETMLICARPGELKVYDVPMAADEYVAVDDHYHLAPMYGLLSDSTPFYVVAITQDSALLFEGDEYDLHFVKQQSYQAKDSNSIHETDRKRYFRHIHEGLLADVDRDRPLILAGTSGDVADYRPLINYPFILDQYISGHHDEHSAHDLFPTAVRIVNEKVVEPKRQEYMAAHQQLRNDKSELASDEIVSIKNAAENGRIHTLVVGMSRMTTDTVDDLVRSVRKIAFPSEIECQAIDDLARKTWNQHGRIVNMDVEQLPGSHLAYALYRY